MAYTDIDKPTDYFNTVLYPGNTNAQSITGVGFQPDLVWIKYRSDVANHHLYDVVRGVQKRINANATNAESTSANHLTAFGTDGFTVGTENDINENGQTYVSWNWKAGGSASSNTDGSITSSVSANTTAGFSIVSYTGNGSAGATIGHGLGVTPAMIIQKIRSSTGNWLVYHHKNTSAPETDFLRLNTTNATADEVTIFNDTAPTSSVFSVGTENTINGNGVTCIAYCFAEKKGFSKFGSYTGNGNADGTFIYTGFKPAFVIIKQSSASGNQWNIYDNKRNTSNVMDKFLLANSNQAEASYSVIDFVSNGIKLRNTASNFNTSGSTYIYMCFAESPFTTSTGIPTTAR
jgi:hypothetical protein